MAYWLIKRFKDHTSEFRDGYFVSPITNETHKLTRGTRHFAEAILDLWPADKSKPEGEQFGHRFTRNLIGEESGLEVSETLFFRGTRDLEQAGVFEIIREGELGHSKGFIFNLGETIRCELKGCRITKHYPADYPLQIDKPPIQNDKRDQAERQETLVNLLDIKNLNNPLRTLNTLNENSKVLESLAGEPIDQEQAEQPLENKDLEQAEPLPPLWDEWTWIIARRKGWDKPSQRDIGYALATYEETGLDLPPGGDWRDGRQYPKPEQQLKTGTN